MVIVKRQNRPISLSKVPDPDRAISATCSNRVQTTLVVGDIENLVDVGSEAQIARLSGLLAQVENSHGIFDC